MGYERGWEGAWKWGVTWERFLIAMRRPRKRGEDVRVWEGERMKGEYCLERLFLVIRKRRGECVQVWEGERMKEGYCLVQLFLTAMQRPKKRGENVRVWVEAQQRVVPVVMRSQKKKGEYVLELEGVLRLEAQCLFQAAIQIQKRREGREWAWEGAWMKEE